MSQPKDEILDKEPLVIVLKDSYGAFVYMNEFVEQNFALPKQGMHGKTEYHFLSDSDASAIRRNDQKVLTEGKDLQTVEYADSKDGERCAWYVHKFRIDVADEHYIGVIGKRLEDSRFARTEHVPDLSKLLGDKVPVLTARMMSLAEKLKQTK